MTKGEFEMLLGAAIREHLSAPNFGGGAPKRIIMSSSEFYQLWSQVEKKLMTGESIFSFSPPSNLVNRQTRQSQFIQTEALLLQKADSGLSKVESEVYEDDKEMKSEGGNLQSLILGQLGAINS